MGRGRVCHVKERRDRPEGLVINYGEGGGYVTSQRGEIDLRDWSLIMGRGRVRHVKERIDLRDWSLIMGRGRVRHGKERRDRPEGLVINYGEGTGTSRQREER